MKIKLEGTVFPTLNMSDVDLIQNEMEVRFPNDYTDFLMDQNGGYPSKCYFELPDRSDTTIVNMFYPIGEMKSNLLRRNRTQYIQGFIAIGNDSGGNQILLAVSGKDSGKVYFWEHDVDPEEENPLHFLANSFNEFLEMLHE